MKQYKFALTAIATLAATVLAAGQAASQGSAAAKPTLKVTAAERLPAATSVKILAATRAGKRIVAVGDYGVVLLSDDDGKTYRQAATVPVSSTLTAVTFVDDRNGWAVGHWGAILKTSDAGQTWSQQRSDFQADQPLFSVHFKNASEGWAVGLWSLMLHTSDGGASWAPVALPPPPNAKKADRNLYAIFGDAKGGLFITSEQGRVLRSLDDGKTWSYAETGYGGSFWSGTALKDGTLLVGGLRGTIYRSTDCGESWQPAKTGLKSSVTAIAQRAGGAVLAVGLDGMALESSDGGLSFSGVQRADRAALTAVLDRPSGGAAVLFSTHGPIAK
jgi:photosystem II stability/assembly factor-like uncharacterized protein